MVYLLDMAARSFAHITTTYEEACLSDPCQDLGILSFPLGCQHVLVAWQLAGTECGCRFDAHSLTGRVMCRFTLEELEDGATAPAHAQGNRIAVAFRGMFGVWDGTSGLLLGRRRPGYEDPDDVDQDDARLHHNLIAANKAGLLQDLGPCSVAVQCCEPGAAALPGTQPCTPACPCGQPPRWPGMRRVWLDLDAGAWL